MTNTESVVQTPVQASTEVPPLGSASNVVYLQSARALRDVVRWLLVDVPIPGVVDVRLLDGPRPKVFVVTDGKNLRRDFEIVRRLVQIEDIKTTTLLNYDIVPQNRAHLLPSDACSVR